MQHIKENEENTFYIILALIRIYMTEIYLNISSFSYVRDYFKNPQHNTTTFIKDHFYHYSSNQFNYKLNFTDVFHQIIFDLLLNQQKINLIISKWIKDYDKYTSQLIDIQRDALNKQNDLQLSTLNLNEQL